jgi:hypothetical protein
MRQEAPHGRAQSGDLSRYEVAVAGNADKHAG